MACAIRPSNVRVYQFHHFRGLRRPLHGHVKSVASLNNQRSASITYFEVAESVSIPASADRVLLGPESAEEPVRALDL